MADEPVANGSVWEWTAKREQAALLLAQGKSWKETAAEVGIGTTTIARWSKVPEFKARIDEHLDEIVAEAKQVLRRNAKAAALQLGNLISHGHAMHGVKLAAARDVLDRVGLKAPDKLEHSGAIGTFVIDIGSDDSST